MLLFFAVLISAAEFSRVKEGFLGYDTKNSLSLALSLPVRYFDNESSIFFVNKVALLGLLSFQKLSKLNENSKT